jgi:hypothetical protein
MAKKTKGKGLSVLSGKALFEYDASLFVDDEEAGEEQVDVSKLKSLMEEEDEEQEEEGEDGGEDGEGLAVAVQENLYLDGEEEEEDLDDLDDDEEEEAEGQEGGSAGEGGGKKG